MISICSEGDEGRKMDYKGASSYETRCTYTICLMRGSVGDVSPCRNNGVVV